MKVCCLSVVICVDEEKVLVRRDGVCARGDTGRKMCFPATKPSAIQTNKTLSQTIYFARCAATSIADARGVMRGGGWAGDPPPSRAERVRTRAKVESAPRRLPRAYLVGRSDVFARVAYSHKSIIRRTSHAQRRQWHKALAKRPQFVRGTRGVRRRGV